MDLPEYKAKELFLKYNIPASAGILACSMDEIEALKDGADYPLVIKAQVPAGGRGKAGGVKAAKTPEELVFHAKKILGMQIKGHTVKKLLLSPFSKIDKELYIGLTLDRKNKCPVLIFSSAGGTDIEETAKTSPELIYRFALNAITKMPSYISRYIAGKSGLDDKQACELDSLLKNLYRLYNEYDCLLCEINPLAVTKDGVITALDGKVTVDDSALFRLPDMAEYYAAQERDPRIAEAEKYNFLFIPYKNEGAISIISNGSGMIMSCIDALAAAGLKVRSSLDLGGGATSDRIKEDIRIICSDEKMECLFINIFGGITRCDEVAGGVKAAIDEYGIVKPVILRFEGTNKDAGLEIIRGIKTVNFVNNLAEGVEALKHEYTDR